MASINDLPNKSILDMAEEEVHSLIMGVRSSRRTVKKEPSKPSTKKPAAKSTTELLNMLSPEMQEELLKRIEGG